MNYVFDSSSLIYFGKIRILEKISLLKGKKFIPKEVYEEVVIKGIERDESEANYIDELIKRELFIVQKVKSDFENITSIPLLSKADMEVLSLAKKTKSMAIIDEIYASNIAESYGIETHGSIYLLLKLVEEKIISKKETINYIDKMIKAGFYLSADKYRNVLDIINEI